MNVLSRIAAFFRGRNAAKKYDADASSAGQLTMADAQLKQQAAVQKMRRGVADVSVSRQRLDLQAADLQQALDSLEEQAAKSRTAGDEGAAQTAMRRHLIMGGQLADLMSQRDALAEQETMLIAALTQLQARVAGFNVTSETLRAAHKAADANQSIAKALEEFDDKNGPAK
ncbi:hypothetical protein ART_3010 [Arthrobacter sp. PAMC 25486]|uniref:PspA/IM30 family protein n=1 Tax=Arthrobacter sp. PAMC 25486 TaxID=1494608 RepID=UPI0005362084|nr:hypothetical protein [Arthrobacter sp. PAMC 25486]AIY02609.1 hypothetical protein ART_3010 [Arthrobacter sp. PAMC 25486]